MSVLDWIVVAIGAVAIVAGLIFGIVWGLWDWALANTLAGGGAIAVVVGTAHR